MNLSTRRLPTSMKDHVTSIVLSIILLLTGIFIGRNIRFPVLRKERLPIVARDSASERPIHWEPSKRSVINSNDLPFAPSSNEDRIQNKNRIEGEMVSVASAEYEKDYEDIFRQLSITDDEKQAIFSRLEVIHRTAIKEGDLRRELKLQKAAYESELRQLLGGHRFMALKTTEVERLGNREASEIKNHSVEAGSPLSEKSVELLREVIVSAAQPPSSTWHRPFDPLPEPIVGVESVRNSMSIKIDNETKRYNTILKLMADQIPESDFQFVQGYLQSKIDRLVKTLDDMPKTEEEAIAQTLARRRSRFGDR